MRRPLGRHADLKPQLRDHRRSCHANRSQCCQDFGLPARLPERLLARGDEIVPIPGTKRVRYLEENVGALAVPLTRADLAALEAIFPKDAAAGTRYTEAGMATLNG